MRTLIDRILGRKNKPAAQSDEPDFNPCEVLEQMLDRLQVQWDVQRFPEHDDERGYTFSFQGGNFRILSKPCNSFIHLQFFYFDDALISELNIVRNLCNDFNCMVPSFKCCYDIKSEENKVCVHLISSLRLSRWTPSLQNDFKQRLVDTFGMARIYRERLEKMTNSKRGDVELDGAMHRRIDHLTHEAEMEMQTTSFRTYDTNHLMLSDMLTAIKGYDVQLGTTRVIDYAATNGNPASEYNGDIDLTALLINDPSPSTSDAAATLKTDRLALFTTIGQAKATSELMISLRHTATAEGIFYFHVDILRLDSAPQPNNSFSSRAGDNERHISFVMSYCPMDDSKKLSEFKYLWGEAHDKARRGAELTSQEQMLMLSEEPNAAQCLYWGMQFFMKRNYYQALLHFENGYNWVCPQHHTLNKAQRRIFNELCYYIGLCYLHLKCPKLAYYYLDGLFNCNNVNYARAYINSIVKSRDYRAMDIVNRMLENVQSIIDKADTDGEIPSDDVLSFELFLRRAYVNVLCDQNRLKEAENELRYLIGDDKSHESYLLRLLSEVISRQAAEAAAAADTSTRSVSADFPRAEQQDHNSGSAPTPGEAE